MNLVDLVGILPTIFSVILAGLENMKIIGQVGDLSIVRFWLRSSRPARSWGRWGWWGSCASSGWFATSSGSRAFSTPCTRCLLSDHIALDMVCALHCAGLAGAWLDPSHCAHHHPRLLKPHIQLWAGRGKSWEMVREQIFINCNYANMVRILEIWWESKCLLIAIMKIWWEYCKYGERANIY